MSPFPKRGVHDRSRDSAAPAFDGRSPMGVLINPHAGGNHHRSGRLGVLTAIVGSAGVVREPVSLAELREAAADFRRQRIGILAVCGGDGSFFRALSALIQAYGE